MSDHNRVTLIQCTNSKRDSVSKARRLYDESDYFIKMREWAEAKGNPWFILSGKHNLVAPDEFHEPYDAVGLSEEQAKDVAEELERLGASAADICAGKKYTHHLIPELEKRGIDVVDNFAGMRIGGRKAELKKRTSVLVNHTL